MSTSSQSTGSVGSESTLQAIKCKACQGFGYRWLSYTNGYSESATCFECGGTGWIDPTPEPRS